MQFHVVNECAPRSHLWKSESSLQASHVGRMHMGPGMLGACQEVEKRLSMPHLHGGRNHPQKMKYVSALLG
jgi:hypothetical protein